MVPVRKTFAVLCPVSIEGNKKSPMKLPILISKCAFSSSSQKTVLFLLSEWDCGTLLTYSTLHMKLQFHKITDKSYPRVMKNQEVPEQPGEYPLSFPSLPTENQHSGL